MIKKDENFTTIDAGERYIIKDQESGSKGIMPILVDTGYKVEIIKLDKGILCNEKENERACDFMLIAKDGSCKIVCMTEIKGTDNEKEIAHAYNQISQSINRIPNNYLAGSDISMAAIVGAQDKTLPRMINHEKKDLCKALFSKTKNKQKVKNMDNLVFYVQPNNAIKRAYVNINKTPYVIECHSKKGAEIPFPSMPLGLVQQ